MEFKVLSVLKKFMSEEQYEAFKDKSVAFETELNSDITKYVTANTPKKEDLEAEARKTAHEEVIKDLGISEVEDVGTLKEYIKTVNATATDKDKELVKITKERNTFETGFNTEVEKREKLENDNKLTSETLLVKGLKIDTFDVANEDHVAFLRTKFDKQVTEELPFSDIVNTYQEENKIESVRHVDPRFSKPKVVVNGQEEDFGARYHELVAKNKL